MSRLELRRPFVRIFALLGFAAAMTATGGGAFAQAPSQKELAEAVLGDRLETHGNVDEFGRSASEAARARKMFHSAEDHWRSHVKCDLNGAGGKKKVAVEPSSYDECIDPKVQAKTPYRSFHIVPKSAVRNDDIAVVMFHGLAGTAYNMAHVGFEIARATGVNVFGLNLSGHAQNFEKPPAGSDTSALGYVTYQDWVKDLLFSIDLAINKHKFKKIIFVGHSTGSLLVKLAALNPELRKHTAGLILMAPPENKVNLFLPSSLAARLLREGVLSTIKSALRAKEMCGGLEDESAPAFWIKDKPEFYREYDPARYGQSLRFLWTSALSRPKAPSFIEYRSPNVNGICSLMGLMDLIQETEKMGKTSVRISLIMSKDDNLINANAAQRHLRSLLVDPNRLFSSLILPSSGHSGFMLSKEVYERGTVTNHVTNPDVWFQGALKNDAFMRVSRQAVDDVLKMIEDTESPVASAR